VTVRKLALWILAAVIVLDMLALAVMNHLLPGLLLAVVVFVFCLAGSFVVGTLLIVDAVSRTDGQDILAQSRARAKEVGLKRLLAEVRHRG
jgi:hypothetical protein